MIAKFRPSRGRSLTAAAFAAGACLALAAPAATATAATPMGPPPNAKQVCMNAANAGYSAAEQAVAADKADQPATAAADDATAVNDVNPVSSECYYVNPSWIYSDILNSYEDLQGAQNANVHGSVANAESIEQSAASTLYTVFITLFNQPPQ